VLVGGLMSGTSLDGIDAALVEFTGDIRRLTWSVRAFVDVGYAPAQRHAIHEAIVAGNAAALCRLHAELGEWFADAALRVCAAAGVATDQVAVLGSHGQTIWHEPPDAGRRGATLQLGCPATIAERTGIAVVSDFRTRDMAAGGEGAPLVPWVDRLLFSAPGKRRVLQNIGGMANLTWLPPRDADEPLLAFDTGPGNALIDAAVELATDGRETYDRDAVWADAGALDEALLDELLAHPFLQREPPKSTGREVFGRPFVQQLVARNRPADHAAWAALISTLTEVTVRSIVSSIQRWLVPRGVDEVVLTGGGASNPAIVRRIAQQLAPVPVRSEATALGVDPAAKEAVAFAALAWAHLCSEPGNVPSATGAAGPRILGSYTPGRTGRQQPEEPQ
jgi:anhydro-N-acetylmuramic acid kinase